MRHFQELSQIAAVVSSSDFKVLIGGIRALEDFRVAVAEALEHPERGKQFFAP